MSVVTPFRGIVLALFISAGLVACGGGSTSTTATTPGSAAVPSATTGGSGTTATGGASGGLSIKSFSFNPNPLAAKAGDIKIENQDTVAHTVTADDGSFDTNSIAPSTTATIHVTKAGSYGFHCKIHPFMKGIVTVS